MESNDVMNEQHVPVRRISVYNQEHLNETLPRPRERC